MSHEFLHLLLVTILFATSQAAAPPLEHYGANNDQVTVSGISSGAFMAVQVHVAYSASIMGVGVVAGGPYWCAQANLFKALGECMETGDINVDYLAGFPTSYALSTRTIDDPVNMINDKIYVFGGTRDGVVNQNVAKAAEEYYRHFNYDDNNYLTEYTIPAEHSMVHDKHGNPCGYMGEPYINNCGYNAAFEMLNHFYGPGLETPTESTGQNGQMFEFDQTEFFKNENAAKESVADTGFVYVPPGCLGDASNCRIHIALHGCLMQYDAINDAYIRYSGYNEVADLNDIIIIYPQTIAKQMGGNPNACWDWWGYASISYACNLAPQMDFMKQIIDRVTA
ncbi:poly(3-hydroxybutyrate) depolymerase-like [Lytechinus pictus]|uniref:poly(3-hydroxybutyrate) depolymerase-like n=1 Tax=Lytechinus pictus TaxID=7653 RepID=UPI0030B9C860